MQFYPRSCFGCQKFGEKIGPVNFSPLQIKCGSNGRKEQCVICGIHAMIKLRFASAAHNAILVIHAFAGNQRNHCHHLPQTFGIGLMCGRDFVLPSEQGQVSEKTDHERIT